MSIRWRWEEQDFGFRFRSGKGRNAQELYQASSPGSFYVIPPGQRKLKKDDIDRIDGTFAKPKSLTVVANPWNDYARDWDWIKTNDEICFNYAGCLDQEEIKRREEEGLRRVLEFIEELVAHPDPVPINLELIRTLHREFMGTIYPFAGKWRNVTLQKEHIIWNLPQDGIQPVMEDYERQILSRSPFISNDDDAVYMYASEVMNEMLAIHPFREGNGRTAFNICNLILMQQNRMLPLNIYNRRRDEIRYYAACESGRLKGDYIPLAALIREWEEEAIENWETL